VKLNLRKISVATVAGALLLATAGIIFSQQPQAPRPGPGDGFGPLGPGAPGGPFDRFGPRGPRGGFGPGGFGAPGAPRDGFGPQGPGPGFFPFGPFGRDLNLTDDQKTAIKKINDSFRESDKALLEQMRALHEGQPDPLSGEFNEAAVRAAAEARAKLQVELEISHAKMMSQMVSVLTAEQKAQLAAKRQEMQRMAAPPPPPDQPPL